MDRLLRVLAALSLLVGTLDAQDTTRLRWVPNPQVTRGSWVADPAGHLRPGTIARIDSIITALRSETTAEMAVVVIDSLDDLDAHSAAFTLHRRWGVGERARDNGIVFLWSPALRQTYISVGPGLEGVLPDAVAGRIQDERVIPAFRSGDFDRGVLAGVEALAATARGETYAGRPAGGRSGVGIVSTIAQVLLAVVAAIGALVGWHRRPRRCPKGHGRMKKLGENLDNSELSREEVLEEQIGSIDYDVWVCDTCDERLILPRRKWFSGYESCPKCKRRTAKRTMKTLVAATYSASGSGEETVSCRNCGYLATKHVVIPRKERSASSGGGGRGGGGGGGGSFGGGSSGGGGAGRSY